MENDMEENKILLDNDNNITFGDTNKQLKLEAIIML